MQDVLKYSLKDDDPFLSVSFAKKGKLGLKQINLQPLYFGPRQISQEKYSDIDKLLKYVPPIHHKFYKEIVHAGKVNSGKHIYEDELLDESDLEGDS